MKISFICGSLNPGRDGVGDYTRRLATQLSADGHKCQLISINDHETAPARIEDGIEIVRFQNALTGAHSEAIAEAIARWDPQWISLQFVCFAFHPKGFIHHLTPIIQALRTDRKLEIMFHELWVGEQPSIPFKHKIMGRIQQWLILHALSKWSPDSLHTSNRLYQYILERHGYKAERLPIFGNIAIAHAPTAADFTRAENERIVLFPFSQRHDWNVNETLTRLNEMATASATVLKLIQIGSLRSGLQHWDTINAYADNHGWQCQCLGAQSEETLSQWMQAADIGISSAHIHLADKSGAAVAMHEHGLPVICTITDPVSKQFKEAACPSEGLFSFFDTHETLTNLFKQPSKRTPQARLPIIADRWIKSLTGK
ncbi:MULTISPECIES: glycosyltransferase family 4 protein [unclassified Lentimonas]|uniref:glycosyltransferase family 4 protein n=1 Tax=unclassified Lentimonas TaxID=2630993 RepID=UPI0013214606|nr:MULTISPECIES: glycosyltransferase family 4 protein [unclassified Lentimonas]CAA6693502.1 Unannotated [Lentimonas sp. CC19]CAA6695838.1 Unannotated [Lentimonas sp. CC10]CAA7069758.1 Unannotated [Lentimonas sp. CC11]